MDMSDAARASVGRAGWSALALAVVAWSATPVYGQQLSNDPLVTHLMGEWQGEGVYQGNRLGLSRNWSLELGEQFLRGDMRVSMADGSTFGALVFWKIASPGTYELLWLDGTGRMQRLDATRDPTTGVVSTTYLDRQAEGGPQWRKWEFLANGPDSYSERVLGESSDGWELLTEFSFRRMAPR